METLKVKFSETEMKGFVNQFVNLANEEAQCFSGRGYEIQLIPNEPLMGIYATILIIDEVDVNPPYTCVIDRTVSISNLQVVNIEGDQVESNLDYHFEQRISELLIKLTK